MSRKPLIVTVAFAVSLAVVVLIVALPGWRKAETDTAGQLEDDTDRPVAASILRQRLELEPDLEAFDDWLEAMKRDTDAIDLAEGVRLAAQRREAMKQLIQVDPASALERALPFEERQELPNQVRDLLEVPVRATGDLEVIAVCGLNIGQSSRIDHFVEDRVAGVRYRAYPVGLRSDIPTKRGISIHGVAVDDVLALASDPVRVIPENERIERGYPQRTLQVGGSFFVAEDDAAIANLRARLVEDERTLGPGFIGNYRNLRSQNFAGIRLLAAAPGEADLSEQGNPAAVTANSSHTEGAKRILYIRARFADQDPSFDPIDLATLQTRQAGVEQFWEDNSFGKSTVTTTYTDTVTLADPAADWPQGLGTLLQQARDAALAAQPDGYDWNYQNYDFYTVVTSGGSGWGYGGVAFVGGKGSHLNGGGATRIRTAAHEFGHNLGLRHANYWRTDSPSPIGRDSVPGGYRGDNVGDERIEYGHKFSTMSAQGGGGDFDAGRGHFTTGEKVHLDWLVETDGDHVSISSSSTLRLYRHDVPASEFAAMTTGVARSIKINRDSDDYTSSGNKRRYWLTHRWLPTNGIAETWLRKGIQIDWQRESYGSDGSIQLDMTPFSRNATTVGGNWTTDNNDKEDSALIVGRTYTDSTADIHITPIGLGGSSPNQWVDVVVNMDTQAGNQAPMMSAFSASATEVGTGVPVTFTMGANDADGDTLAYSWDFGDNSLVTSALNSATAVKSWSSAGQYVVRATVSDMKGGIDTRDVVITVGSPSDIYQISGRVLHGGQPVQGARVNVSNTDQTWTESDGTYTIAGLATGDYTVEAAKHGLTLTPQFANPVTLSSLNAFGKDFHAEEGLSGSGGLTMAVTPFEVELPIGASMPFSANGWDLGGNPVSVSPVWSVDGGGTIDSAGVFSASIEGSHTITATQGATTATATVNVLNLSAVGITAVDDQASEPGSNFGVVRVQRYGDKSEALTVQLTLAGSATSGIDYTVSSTSIDFAAEQSSVDIPITVLNDYEVESSETVIIGLATDPNYQVFGGEATATVTISDDGDVGPEVTILSPLSDPAFIPSATGLVLKGSATDDGFPDPPGALTANWSMVSGPAGATVSFSPPGAFETLARFSVPGPYVLALTASDGPNSTSAETRVVVGIEAGTPSSVDEIIYYTFDEGTGTTANDSRGGDHDGTLANGAAWTAADGGVSGSAVQLDGVNDQVEIADSGAINNGTFNERTIAFWFKAADPGKPTKQVLFEEGGGSRGLNLYLESDTLYFGGWNNNENGWDETYLSVSLDDSEWHHVAIVLDAPNTTNGDFIGYLDGFEISRGTGGAINSHTGDIAIGAMRDATRYHDGSQSGAGDRFEGWIDEFHLWNRALSAQEIGQLFVGDNQIGSAVTLNTGQSGLEAVVVPGNVGLVLDGTVEDTGSAVAGWAAVSSPPGAVVNFEDSDAAATTVTFSDPGYYRLRLTAAQGQVTTGSEIHSFFGIDEAANPSTANQVIYFSLDEASGSTAVDQIGNDNNGTLTNGPVWTAADGGISGSALSFDGTDDVVAIDNSSSINSGTFNQRTIALWFKANDPGGPGKEVLYEEGGGTRGLSLYLDGGILYFGGWNGNVNDWNQTFLSTPVIAGKWYHAVLTLDVPADGTLIGDGFSAYLNGILVGTGEGAEMISHTGNIGLGGMRDSSKFHDGSQSGDGNFFSGIIDEFHLWTGRVLTHEEIGALYAFGNVGPFVDAGEDVADAPGFPNVALSASSSDDGRWEGTLTHTWSVVSSPAAVQFTNPDANGIPTIANLTAPGQHIFRLTADDGQVATFSEVSIIVENKGYLVWTEDFPLLSEADLVFDANPDGDAFTNLEEFAYGGNPGLSDSFSNGMQPVSRVTDESGTSYAEFQFRRRRDFPARGIIYSPEFSATMAGGSWTTSGVTEVEAVPIDADFELVTVRVDGALLDASGRGFVRLNLQLVE